MEAAGRACAHGAVAPRPVKGPRSPAPSSRRGLRLQPPLRRGRGGNGEGRREGGFLPPHTQSRSRIYRVSRLGAERRERFACGWSTCRSLGEGPGFTAPLVEPQPRRRSRYSRGLSPALTEPTPRRPRGAGGGPGGRLGRCAGGAGPCGPRGRVGVRPGGAGEAVWEALPSAAAPGRPPALGAP